MIRILAAGLALSTLLLAGCPKQPITTPDTIGPKVNPKPNMYLRSSFDTDPSSYIGRFVPTGMTNLDETSAMQLTCGQYIKYKRIGGGGVQYDEVYQASTSAAASFGIPLVASITGGHESGTNVRVKYVLTAKMVANIEEPAAFEACCKQAADQCTDLFIGEFMEGTGELYYATAQGTSGKGGANLPQGDLAVEFKNGVAWAKSIAFPNPVYFAFKTTKNQYTGQGPTGCGDWVNAPPRSTQGQYFVGLSDPMQSERVARDAAIKNARVQTVQWAGQAISEGSIEARVNEGVVQDITSALREDTIIETASKGVATHVKDEAWCVTTQASPSGSLYVAKVLAFIPKEATQDIADAVMLAVKGEE
ncbi:MAG: hypothetical protein HN348_02100 [Proteobacteria bacterium]|nr:hypothetical protein [Pseudomonadota bacterium]